METILRPEMGSFTASRINWDVVLGHLKSYGCAVLLATCLSARVAADGADNETELFIRGANPDFRAISSSDVGRSHIFDRARIDSFPALTTDSFLEQIPGFSLFRRSGSLVAHPTTQGVSLRGTGPSGASRTLVLLDGIPMNDAFGGWVNWQRIPVEGLERIRVQENWGSPHFSYLGLGNTIELQTREPGEAAAELKLAGGTQETGVAHLSGGGTFEGLGFSGGGKYFESGGYEIISPEDRGSIDTDASSEHRLGYGKLTYGANADTRGYLVWNAFDEERDNGTPLTNNQSRALNIATGGTIRNMDGSRARFNLFATRGAFQSTFSSQSGDRNSETPASDQFDVPSEMIGIEGDWSVELDGRQYLEIGVDALRRSGSSREHFRFEEGTFRRERFAGAELEAFGGYLYDRYRFDSRWTIDAMLRVNTWRYPDLFRREQELETGLVDRDEWSHESTRYFAEPRIQLSYELNSHSRIRSALIRGMRIPTVNELVRPFRVRNDITEANPGLTPENIIGYDFEYHYDDDVVEFELIPYLNRIRKSVFNVTLPPSEDGSSLCGFVPEGGTCRQRNNVDEVWVGGVEVTASYHLDDSYLLRSSYLLSESEVTDAGRWHALEGKKLAQLPQHQASVRLERAGDKAVTGIQARYVGRQFEDDLNTLPLGSFVTFDISTQLRLTSNVSLFVTIENLFGTRAAVGKSSDGSTTIGAPLVAIAGSQWRF